MIDPAVLYETVCISDNDNSFLFYFMTHLCKPLPVTFFSQKIKKKCNFLPLNFII